MALPPVPPDFRSNRRDDGFTDFDALKASGWVRDKRGNRIAIDAPHVEFSALQRDRLFQAYCQFAATHRTDAEVRAWIKREAAVIVSGRDGRAMSPARATRVIGQGLGEWDSPNSMWWRGVSLP